MEENSNTIIKCLAKTLNSPIKFVTVVSIKYINDNDGQKKQHVSGEVVNNDKILCFGEELVFILDDNMSKLEETFKYDAISYIKKEAKPDYFLLYFKSGTKLNNPSTNRLLFTTKQRADIMKNFMCYYSIFNRCYYFYYKSHQNIYIKILFCIYFK